MMMMMMMMMNTLASAEVFAVMSARIVYRHAMMCALRGAGAGARRAGETGV